MIKKWNGTWDLVGQSVTRYIMRKSNIKKGQRFNQWLILQEVNSRNGRRYFKCKCTCGVEKEVQMGNLVSGKSKSCGCLQKEWLSNFNTKHGHRQHKLYDTWNSMKQRCANPNSTRYKDYGERGITVCEKWSDIENFIKDMYPSYVEGYQLDRIDNDKGYSKDNCRWVTPQQNQWNTKSQKGSTSKYKGVHKSKSKWAAKIKGRHLGTFATEEEAAIRYNKEAIKLFGEYAYLNKIETYKEDYH